ncbi:hypothetical protein GCM10007870_18880 [Gluconobacter kondonii]|uniref:Transposase n=1 Tax=Gluconobacter kondonii TaxID=941463 RepID=A0ABQ5WSF9_9PROT|nr:transposase [Gluconobacter kondonii NBRC 3266]GLQ66304.1 hypothetical protein GCM10007870_18880 [Gluconobacter kondonii]
MKLPRFFNAEERFARLSELGDQLEAFSRIMDFRVFLSDLTKHCFLQMGAKAAVRRLIHYGIQNTSDLDI